MTRTLIILSLALMVGCRTKNDPADFHVSVECFGGGPYYTVEFHQGSIPFYKSGHLMDAFDNDDIYEKYYHSIREVDNWFDKIMWQGEDVIHQELLENKPQAIAIAQTIKNYEMAMKWNRAVQKRYDSLVVYRKANPIKYIVKRSVNCCSASDNVIIK